MLAITGVVGRMTTREREGKLVIDSSSRQHLHRRRFLQLALGGAGVSLLAACAPGGSTAKPAATAGAAAAPAAAAPASASTQGTLRIALFGSRSDADRRAALIPGFNKLYPNVKVEYTPIQGTDWEEFFS